MNPKRDPWVSKLDQRDLTLFSQPAFSIYNPKAPLVHPCAVCPSGDFSGLLSVAIVCLGSAGLDAVLHSPQKPERNRLPKPRETNGNAVDIRCPTAGRAIRGGLHSFGFLPSSGFPLATKVAAEWLAPKTSQLYVLPNPKS